MPSGSVSMWLTVQGGFTVSVWLVSPAQGGAGRTMMTLVLVAVVGWQGDVW